MPATIDAPPLEEIETRRTPPQPPYAVILHNDDVNGMDFVIVVLRKVFGYTPEKCSLLMLEAHNKGKVVVWSGAREVAELKADQIHSCGPDPDRADAGAEALRVSIEPMA